MELKGKRAIVTGGTSGIGLGIARALAAEGAAVTIGGLGEADAIEKARRGLEEASGGAVARHDGADMADPDAIERLVKDAADAMGGVDILMCNAGIQHVCGIADFPASKWDAIIAINLSSAFHLMRHAVPLMRDGGWGRIVCTASAHSLTASPNKSAYVAAKHGLAGLVKTVALETAREGITVNCISPGYVWTPLVEQQIPDTMKARGMSRDEVMNDVLLAGQPTRAFVTVEQVAGLALHLCRDQGASITGANLSIDGGWTAQ